MVDLQRAAGFALIYPMIPFATLYRSRPMVSTRCQFAALVTVSFALAACTPPQEKLRTQGINLYDQGNYEAAQADFAKALSYDEFDARTNYYAGADYEKQGKYAEAEYHLKLAWQADPGYPDVKESLTEVLLRQGKTDAALDFLERDAALTAKVKDPRATKYEVKHPYQKQTEERMFLGRAEDRYRIAQTYEKIGDMENAAINYRKAIAMSPSNTGYMVGAAQFFTRINNKPAAIEILKKAYAIDPATPGLVDLMTRDGLSISQTVQP
jgi:tetratricopeptide (TPR) repeat protein